MLNEFRQDPISGEWVLFATNRAKNHLGEKRLPFHQSLEECPFEDLEKAGGGQKPFLVFSHGQEIPWDPSSNWTTAVMKNGFPALQHGVCGDVSSHGFWQKADALGFHELVVTRDHEKQMAQFNDQELAEVLGAYQARLKSLQRDSCGKYVLILHNHGASAGASVYHNHSQIMSLPFVPPGITSSILRAEKHNIEHGVSLFEVMLDWERKEGKRIVYENKSFSVFCPYASRTPYELKIFPISSESCFETLSAEQVFFLAQALRTALAKISAVLNNPDYNFYIHNCPVDSAGKPLSETYRWHIEIVPRLSIIGSLELGTNIFVNVVDPDEAAEKMRDV